LLARGVKKITSKNSAHLEPFSVMDIGVAHGKEIDHLTKVQPVEYFKNIRNDLEKSLAAQYVVELTDRLVHVGEVDIRLFDLLQLWLEFISINQFKSMLVDCYIVSLLHCFGFSLSQDERVKGSQWLELVNMCEIGDWKEIFNFQFSIFKQ